MKQNVREQKKLEGTKKMSQVSPFFLGKKKWATNTCPLWHEMPYGGRKKLWSNYRDTWAISWATD